MAQGKTLVVEDNPLNREMIITVLKAYGYIVPEAEDGLGLMERVKAERPGLIVMDLQLPKIDGFAMALSHKWRRGEHKKNRTLPERGERYQETSPTTITATNAHFSRVLNRIHCVREFVKAFGKSAKMC